MKTQATTNCLCGAPRTKVRGSTSTSGQLTIIMALITPFIILLFALFVNVSQMVLAKIHLQNITDRATYEGSKILSDCMNKIAKENWRIHDKFRWLKKNVETFTNDSIKTSKQKFDEYNELRQDAEENISYYIKDANREALQTAESIIKNGLKNAFFTPLYGLPNEDLLVLADNIEPNQEASISAFNTSGGSSFTDPEKIDCKKYKTLKYFVKDPSSYVAYAGMTLLKLKPILLPKFFGTKEITAVSAAQPYGGSIKEFSFNETLDTSEGKQHLYKTSFIPAGIFLGDTNE